MFGKIMKPNILFIVIDSLRADKCYGNEKTSVTPNIDKLIENVDHSQVLDYL